MRAAGLLAAGVLVGLTACSRGHDDGGITARAGVEPELDQALELALTTQPTTGAPVASELEAPRPVVRPQPPAPQPSVAAAAEPAPTEPESPQLDEAPVASVADVAPMTPAARIPVPVPVSSGAGAGDAEDEHPRRGPRGATGDGPHGPAGGLPGVIIRGGRGEEATDPCRVHVPRVTGDALINERVPPAGVRGALAPRGGVRRFF